MCKENLLLPKICNVIRVTPETPDVKTFRVQTPEGKKPFDPLPGQLGMLSLLGNGEAMFSITASGNDWLDFAVKKCGTLTDALHEIVPGQQIGLRGPYGNTFPLEQARGKKLLLIGGGIGLAPLRSLILYALVNRPDFGHIDILYGSRTYDDLVFKEDLFEKWPAAPDTKVHVTVDRGSPGWMGNVGFVPPYLEECAFSPDDCLAVVCGPPVMIKLCMESLEKMGFPDQQVITTLEMRMQCGVGKCGRCNVGSKFVCLDGPVFSKAQLRDLPLEW